MQGKNAKGESETGLDPTRLDEASLQEDIYRVLRDELKTGALRLTDGEYRSADAGFSY